MLSLNFRLEVLCVVQEFDTIDDPKLSQSERLAKQRKNLKSRLGLGGPVDQLMDTVELIKDEDLVSGPGLVTPSSKIEQKDASALISEMTGKEVSEYVVPAEAFALMESGMRKY